MEHCSFFIGLITLAKFFKGLNFILLSHVACIVKFVLGTWKKFDGLNENIIIYKSVREMGEKDMNPKYVLPFYLLFIAGMVFLVFKYL